MLLVFLYDLDGAQKKEAFAAACAKIYHAVQRASLAALLSFNCSFATVGWGCGYAGLQHVPAALGYASLLALCFVALLLLHGALRDETELSAAAAAKGAAAKAATAATTATSVGGLEAHLSTLAVRSSIASGFVFYHLITFRTDIDDVETVYGKAFLVVHAVAFALAITASIAAHITWIALSTAFDNSKMRMARCAEFLVAQSNHRQSGIALQHGIRSTSLVPRLQWRTEFGPLVVRHADALRPGVYRALHHWGADGDYAGYPGPRHACA